jgi:hypothetical protein
VIVDEMELLGRVRDVDPLPEEVAEKAETVLRAAIVVSRNTEPLRIEVRHHERWSRRRTLTGVAAAVVIAASAGGALLAAGSGPRRPAPGTRVAIVLTAAEVHHIAASSVLAAASSGTAEVTETSSMNGTPQTNDEIAVTFDGSNIDEKITVNPEPPGSAKTFTTDDRLVDGQFYIYTPGPGDVLEWLHDTNSTNDTASMQFPDPRTLYGAINPSANFEVTGTSTSDGTTLTHLVALDPVAIDMSALGNLVQGALTSFQMTVNQNDVVQQMTFASSSTEHGCTFAIASGKSLANVKAELQKEGVKLKEIAGPGGKKLAVVSTPGNRWADQAAGITSTCGPQMATSQVNVAFSNLGVPESVTAPQGAVDFAGKG